MINWPNPKTGQKEKVVVTTGGGGLTSIELLFLNNIEAGWKIGPEFENGWIWTAKMIEYKVLDRAVFISLFGSQDTFAYMIAQEPWCIGQPEVDLGCSRGSRV